MDSTRARILVIDDSIDICEFLQLALESTGYDVEAAADGLEGLELVRTFRPQLIISDVSMPRMNGFEFLVHLRSDFTPPLPPVVVCSGFDVTAEEALRLGAVRFLAKPIDMATLLKIVEHALRGETSDPASLAHEREYVRAARARTAAAAARLLAGVDLQNPDLLRTFNRFVQWVSNYFGYAQAALALVQGGDLWVAAVSRGTWFSAGFAISGKALYSTGLLASGSSLVLSDAADLPRFGDPKAAALKIGFLVGVPLVFQDVPVGALCLIDREPKPFHAEDLIILEQIGRFAASGFPDVLERLLERRLTGNRVGLLRPAVFDCMLAAELAILHRERGGLDLVFVEIDPASLDPDWVARLPFGTRLGLCRRSDSTLAIFKRDSTPAAASAALSDLLSALRTVVTVHALGWISVVDDGLTRIPNQVLLQLAGIALEEARSSPTRPVGRIVIRHERAPTDHFVED